MSLNGLAFGPAPNNFRVEYNGFRLPRGARTRTFTISPLKDSAGRTIAYSRFFLEVEAYFNLGAASTDALVQNAVSLLTQPAAGLVYNGRGFGDIRINLGAGSKDVIWGPMPQVVSLETKGATVKIIWSVEWHAPTCGDARYDGPMEFAYHTAISIDRMGLSRRVYSGFIRLAATRPTARNRRVNVSADQWREKINPPLLVGFRRIPGEFTTSADKCRLDFSVTDEELPSENTPPQNVVEVDASHSYTTAQAGRLYEWVGSLSATYKIPKGHGLGITSAVEAFRKLLEDRTGQLIRAGALGPRVGSIDKVSLIPISFTASEPAIYGDTQIHLDMRYRVAAAALEHIMNRGGLWRRVPETTDAGPGGDWETWVTSIKEIVGPRGLAGLYGYRPGEEEIVDLCARIPADPVKKSRGRRPTTRRPVRAVKPSGTVIFDGRVLGEAFGRPDPNRSWLDYSVVTRIETDSGITVGKTLPGEPIEPAPRKTPWDVSQDLPVGGSATVAVAPGETRPRSPDSAGETFFHRRATPTIYVYLTGSAFRAGYPIPCPELVRLGDVGLVAANRLDRGEGFTQGIVGAAGLSKEIPIYGAQWSLRYLCPAIPRAGQEVPPNPITA